MEALKYAQAEMYAIIAEGKVLEAHNQNILTIAKSEARG